MKFYIVYIAATGEIVRTGVCPDDMLTIQSGTGELVTEGIASDADYRVTTAAITAVGTITMSGIAIEDETFIVDSQTFTWKVTRTQKGEVTIGINAPEAVTNIVTAVTADLSTVIAVDGIGDTVVIMSVHAGIIGNSIIFSEASTNMAMNGSGFLGGTTAGVDVVLTEKILITAVATWDKMIITSDGTDAATLGAGLPNPTTVSTWILSANGAESVSDFDVTDASLIFKSLIAGQYLVSTKASGYKTYAQMIRVCDDLAVSPHLCSQLQSTAIPYVYIVRWCSQGQTTTLPSIIQKHLLAIGACSETQIGTSPTIIQGHIIVTDSCSQVQATELPSIIQTHILTMESDSQVQSATSPVATVKSVVLSDSEIQIQSVDQPTIIQGHILVIGSCSQSQISDEVTVEQL